MAFVDVSGNANAGAMGGIAAGAGTGGVPNTTAVTRSAPGTNGYGGSWSVRTWVFIYLGFIVAMLVVTGVLFNGKGRK